MALTFDGTNDKVSYGDIDALDTPGAFTIAMWVSVDEAGSTTNDGLYHKSTTAATNGFCQLFNNGGSGFRFFINATAYNKTTMFADTAYRHLTVVFDGSGAANADRLKAYLNGVEQTADSYTGTVPTAPSTSGTTAFEVGLSNVGSAGFGAASIGHVKVWTAALSAAEVLQEVYSHSPVRANDLLIWSPYDDGTGTNYSGTSFTGTVTEATLSTGPPQVLYGNRVLSPTRSRRVTRRSNYDSFRRLGPYSPLYWKGL